MDNLKQTKTHRFLSRLRRDITESPWRLIRLVCSVFPIEKKKILIDYPYHRETIAVTERLIREKKDYDIVLAGCKRNDEGVRYVKPDTLRYVYELATAGIWIDSVRKKQWVRKRRKQLYIQTWHGAVAMKKVEKDAEAVLPGFYVQRAKNDSRMANYMVAETKEFKETMKNSFWYSGPILEGEFKDGMLDPIDRDAVCSVLGISATSRIILYAPTFRVDGNMNCYDMDYNLVVDTLKKKTGEDWKIIIRLHPVVSEKCNNIKYSENIINGTEYPKLGDLMSLADIVMTDYSSCMFYGYRAMKPVFIYASDFEEYMQKDRGGYFKYEDLPASVLRNTQELIAALDSFDKTRYEKSVKEFNDRIGYYENDVMDEIIRIIEEHVKCG